jgi:hypothetical protein
MPPAGKGTDSPCIPRCATGGPVSCRLRAYGAARYARSAVQRAASMSMNDALRALRVQGDHLPARRRLFCFRICMSPTGKGTDSPCIPRCATGGPVSCRFRAYGAARYARSSAVQRAAGMSMNDALRVLRVQGDHLPARRRLFCFRICMSPTGKGTDSPCIPRCATGGPVSCRFRAYGAARYARCRHVYERCAARIEGAGRSSPCPPEAVLFQVLYASGGQGD